MQISSPHEQNNCPTCSLTFTSNALHHAHYKSELHRYNVKRKLVKLLPVTEEVFSTKNIVPQATATQSLVCGQCRKSFNSIKTLTQHATSKGHNLAVVPEQQHPEKPKKQLEPFKKNSLNCVFCELKSLSEEANVKHMSRLHSFFIPQENYCRDRKGLIEYLQEKVFIGNMCLLCDNKGKDFPDGDSVRKHMIAKGHTFMKTEEGYEEYQKFYDFSELFEQKLLQQGEIVPGIEFQEVKVLQDGKEGEDDEDWEDEQDSQDEEQETQTEKKVKTYKIMRPTLTGTDQLLLPNGKTLGHRKYRQLYEQTYRLATRTSKMRMIGGIPNENTVAQRMDIVEMYKREKIMHKEYIRATKKYVKLGVNNNALQHHFRIQNSM